MQLPINDSMCMFNACIYWLAKFQVNWLKQYEQAENFAIKYKQSCTSF